MKNTPKTNQWLIVNTERGRELVSSRSGINHLIQQGLHPRKERPINNAAALLHSIFNAVDTVVDANGDRL